MEATRVNENEYSVSIYDWVGCHDDYICGHIKRKPNESRESDLRFWMFYPIGGVVPMNCGNLRRIYELISELNAKG